MYSKIRIVKKYVISQKNHSKEVYYKLQLIFFKT